MIVWYVMEEYGRPVLSIVVSWVGHEVSAGMVGPLPATVSSERVIQPGYIPTNTKDLLDLC